MPESSQDYLRHLEDGDRWLELVGGRIVRLSPPDERHGNVVRNLSKALSAALRKESRLYPCFELALLVERDPDTVRCPAISCFPLSGGLGELDKLLTDTRPELIVEVASSNDRREAMSDRVEGYLDWGVPHLWICDPASEHVHVFEQGQRPRMLKPNEYLSGGTVVLGFGMLVGELFADPAWLKN
ncbi:MAG: Uma2 family endonuclease [Planctomycetaceae bacterium]|nr:Uma2 family endonuclease [Planctomycetaceae bacterium]